MGRAPSPEMSAALCALLGLENLNQVKRVVLDIDVSRHDGIHVYVEEYGETSAAVEVLRAVTSPVIQQSMTLTTTGAEDVSTGSTGTNTN